ncbi:TetR/AcrR family transcriptional regulator [Ferrimonas lipolytica]|uniref:TetR/AcrR family transcriptional regulator n=1 Tax=Ferrimonas lipolytica TaxID=2724191 RepID=A0A6H1UI19_9GAMM|nr:TetR/AcrR family transcriptional regulator [Ferrimonas lipolytica]QIZ78684.1 TetR/AcrR family transcriptional regulator [Ferrimonas lipolytica]
MQCPKSTNEQHACTKILDAAEQLVAEFGIVSFRFAEVAQRANCSNYTLYKHFKSKEDLLVCLFLRNCATTSLHGFITSNPDLTPRQLAVCHPIFSFVATQRSKTFRSLRLVSVNSLCWQLASNEKETALRRRVDLFWNTAQFLYDNAQRFGELKLPASDVHQVTQSIGFFLAGILSAYGNKAIGAHHLGDSRDRFFHFLTMQLNQFVWETPFEVVELQQVEQRINKFFDNKISNYKNCPNCNKCNEISEFPWQASVNIRLPTTAN